MFETPGPNASMTGQQHRGARRLWIVLAGAATLSLIGWPLFAGIVASGDDLSPLLFRLDHPSFAAAIRAAWSEHLFRPLAVVAASLTDPVSRSCKLVVPLHAIALAAGAAALDRLARRQLETAYWRWAAIALWLLHPGTAIAAWQMDTVSQTACAAAGLWLLALALGAWAPRRRTLAWITVTMLGLLTKETFLGWVLVAAAVGIRVGLRSKSMRERRGELIGALMALVFVVLRVWEWGVGTLMSGEQRYSIHLGMPLVRNLGLAVVGLLTFGPSHALRLGTPTDPLWIIAAAGAIAHLMLLVMGSRRAILATAGTWMVSLLALAPVLPMGHISELYLCGPNALVSLAVVRASAFAPNRRRHVSSLCMLVVVLAALAGHVSRGYHFGKTWRYARTLTAQLEPMAASRTAPSPTVPCGPPVVYHSVYVVSPAEAVSPHGTPELMRRLGHPLPEHWIELLDCSQLAP